MGSDSHAARSSATILPRGRDARPLSPRWRLPFGYGAIPAVALALDVALILASAIGAESLYHEVPAALEGEFSHTLAAAMFVAVLFVAAMRI